MSSLCLCRQSVFLETLNSILKKLLKGKRDKKHCARSHTFENDTRRDDDDDDSDDALLLVVVFIFAEEEEKEERETTTTKNAFWF